MRNRVAVAGLVVAFVLFSLTMWFVLEVRNQRVQAQMERALAEEARARAEARLMTGVARANAEAVLQHSGALEREGSSAATSDELERLRTENAALKARVRELEQKLGPSGARRATVPALASGSPSLSP
jgi:biopolymer transport protein ExbB/TolQ